MKKKLIPRCQTGNKFENVVQDFSNTWFGKFLNAFGRSQLYGDPTLNAVYQRSIPNSDGIPKSLISEWFDKKENVEKVMKSSGFGDWRNFFHMFDKNSRDSYYGSRKVGQLIKTNTMKEPVPDKSRDLVSQYLYKRSSLVPYQNATPIIVDGEQWKDDQFEGKIFLQPNMVFPKQMEEIINDYINNKRLLVMEDNTPIKDSWYEHDFYGNTYDNVRGHYVSFKKDSDGNIYAVIFDRWDMDHSLVGKLLEKKHGNPFILRQKVPIIYQDKHDDNTMAYFKQIHHKNSDFKDALFNNFDTWNLYYNEDRLAEHYGDDEETYKDGGKLKNKLIEKMRVSQKCWK